MEQPNYPQINYALNIIALVILVVLTTIALWSLWISQMNERRLCVISDELTKLKEDHNSIRHTVTEVSGKLSTLPAFIVGKSDGP